MDTISKRISSIIDEIKNDGLYKDERIILSQQNAEILVGNNNGPIQLFELNTNPD